MSKSYTAFEVQCHLMGWDPAKVTRRDFAAVSPKRYPMTKERWNSLMNSDQIWKICEVCGKAMIVNNWPDKRPRTPKLFDFIVCPRCDPRHPDDRGMKKGYRIMFPDRLRILRMMQVTRAVAKHGCLKDNEEGCKCAGCVAPKILKPPAYRVVPDDVIYG